MDALLNDLRYAVRMAQGATPRTVARSVLRQAMLPVAGLVGAIGARRAVRAMLFNVSPVDPLAALRTE